MIFKKRTVGVPIEHFKGVKTKFWDGFIVGLIVGYIPYLYHMNF